MKRIIIPAAIFAMTALLGLEALGHYHAIRPADYGQWRARKGETVPVQLIWGHGYEHIWFDIAKPESFELIAPDGSKTDLLPALAGMKVKAVSGEEKAAYGFEIKPEQRGDHVFSLVAGKQWDGEDGVWLADYVKGVFHVQSESDWDRVVGHKVEVVPLSRPYGLLPGDALAFKILKEGKPVSGVRVERELLSEKMPSEASLPSEPFIAYSAKSDADGLVTFAFPLAGWHGVTAIVETGETHSAGGHEGKITRRATFWVYVSEKPE